MAMKQNSEGFGSFRPMLTGAVAVLIITGAYIAVGRSANSATTTRCQEAAIAAANAEMNVLHSTPYANIGVSPDHGGGVVYISPDGANGYNKTTDTLRRRTIVLSDNDTADPDDDIRGTLTVYGSVLGGAATAAGARSADDGIKARVVVKWLFLDSRNTYETELAYFYKELAAR